MLRGIRSNTKEFLVADKIFRLSRPTSTQIHTQIIRWQVSWFKINGKKNKRRLTQHFYHTNIISYRVVSLFLSNLRFSVVGTFDVDNNFQWNVVLFINESLQKKECICFSFLMIINLIKLIRCTWNSESKLKDTFF